MSEFEFVLSLIGLVLGLSLVELLSGLVRAIKARRTVRMGALTPLLGIVFIGNVTGFWGRAWENRGLLEALPSIWPIIGVGVVLTSVFFVAASFVFPDPDETVPDLDAHYWKYKRLVLLLTSGCGVALVAIELLMGRPYTPLIAGINAVLIGLAVLVAFLPGKRINVALLSVLLALDVFIFSF
ncbi:MAG: hypothetical protein WDN24_21415 [Sphingomonas sp.]